MCAMTVANSMAANQVCKPDERDKQECDRVYEDDLDNCHGQFDSGLRGPGFRSAWKACVDHAARRRDACYKGASDPGPFNGNAWPGGRKR